MTTNGMAVRIWNASPMRLVGPASQGDLSLNPATAVTMVYTRAAERFIRQPHLEPPSVPFSYVSVYRRRNMGRIKAMTPPPGSTYLWALDEIAPELAAVTVGVGPGNRFELINQLLAARADLDDWLVIADDDVTITQGSIANAVAVASLGEFDLCALSHSRWSYLNWGCTLHRPWSIAREVRYVEQGPVLIISPRAQRAVLPFPEDLGMGWGIEAQWAGHRELRLGILDAVNLRHLAPVNKANYHVPGEWTQALKLLESSGYDTWAQMQRTLASWSNRDPLPPWHSSHHNAGR